MLQPGSLLQPHPFDTALHTPPAQDFHELFGHITPLDPTPENVGTLPEARADYSLLGDRPFPAQPFFEPAFFLDYPFGQLSFPRGDPFLPHSVADEGALLSWDGQYLAGLGSPSA